MFSPQTVIAVFCIYGALLFLIALWVEKKAAAGRDIGNNPVIYSLSLAVYLTAWTFYGSVGNAVTSGMLFFTFYIGPTLVIFLWWTIIRKMIRIKNTYRITSIADFISVRYDKSQSIAALVTVIAIVGIVPYIALQLKAIFSAFDIVTHPLGAGISSPVDFDPGLVIVLLMAIFTIIFGVRRLDPTERHQGMVVVLAVESVVKLVAFLAVGIFVTYFLFGGFQDILNRLSASELSKFVNAGKTDSGFYFTWASYLILSMSAVMFLPRQFHVAVVENFNENHIRTAMWLFPVYMFLMTIFIYPVAMGGLLMGHPVQDADKFVLSLPFSSGHSWLSMLVLIGGFSASTGMVMICSMTISTMFTNHLLLPFIEWVGKWDFLKRYLLQCRWISVIAFMVAGFWYERRVGEHYMLVGIGMISFTAILQFAPAILGGLFWKKGNKAGAFLGMATGFLLWFYTLILPAFAKSGWIPKTLIENGPWGIEMLRPEHLFGVTGLDYLSHAVLWTMLFNIGLYFIGSLYFEQTEEEQNLSEEFVNALAAGAGPVLSTVGETFVDCAEKKRGIEKLLCQYFPKTKSAEIIEQCLHNLNIDTKNHISIVELAELHNEVEKHLAGSIGAAAAHHAIRKSAIFTSKEEMELKKAYAKIIAELRLSPADLKGKIDYYREKERLLTLQATELEERIRERDKEITERMRAEEALRESEQKLYRIIQGSPTPTFVISKDHKILYWNKALEELTGFKAEDMVGTTQQWRAFYSEVRPCMADILADEDLTLISQYYQDKYIKSTLLEETYEARDFFPAMGEKGKWLSFTAAAIRNSYGNLYGAIETLEDITERKRLEAEEIYKTLTESSPTAVFVVQKGKFRFINTSVIYYTGYTADELIGRDSDIIVHPEDKEMVKRMAQEMLHGARNAAFEFRMVTRENRIRWISQTVSPIKYEGRPAILGNAIDVTDLKESRAKLEELMALESSILASIPSVVMGLQNDRILFVNDNAESIFGWKPEELAGKNISILYGGDYEYIGGNNPLGGGFENQPDRSREIEIPCRHRDGRSIICRVTTCGIRDSSGDDKMVATFEDITDKKKSSIQLLQSEKMASIGQLAAGVAHEINNPTAFVSSNLKTLSEYVNDIVKLIKLYRALGEDLKKEIDTEKYRDTSTERLKLIEELEAKTDIDYVIKDIVALIGESREGTGRIGRIVQDLKNFAHPGDEKLKAVNINDSIESTLNIVWNELKYKAVVHKEYGDVPDVLGYPQQLNQVFMNILVNAAQAIKEKGEIRIVTRTNDGHAEIKFTDTGVGIPKENLSKIFDPFFTTKDVGKGTGLGLHVAYNIIDKHKGTIEVNSIVNTGTTFTIKIPFVKSEI